MIMTLVYYVCHLHRSTMITGAVELLQRHSRGHIDVSILAAWEQVRDGERLNKKFTNHLFLL